MTDKDPVEDSSSVPPLAEKRELRRRRMLLTGVCIFGDGKYNFDCTIRELSETGLKVSVPRGTLTGNSMYVLNVRDGLVYSTTTAWTNGSELGLKIVNTVKLDDITDPKLGHIRRIWVEKMSR